MFLVTFYQQFLIFCFGLYQGSVVSIYQDIVLFCLFVICSLYGGIENGKDTFP